LDVEIGCKGLVQNFLLIVEDLLGCLLRGSELGVKTLIARWKSSWRLRPQPDPILFLIVTCLRRKEVKDVGSTADIPPDLDVRRGKVYKILSSSRGSLLRAEHRLVSWLHK